MATEGSTAAKPYVRPSLNLPRLTAPCCTTTSDKIFFEIFPRMGKVGCAHITSLV